MEDKIERLIVMEHVELTGGRKDGIFNSANTTWATLFQTCSKSSFYTISQTG